MEGTFVIGDIHGQYEKLARLLTQSGLVTPELDWNGGPAELWFMGDFTDRGQGGIPVVRLIRKLQKQAGEAGGKVGALMGNHDMLILSAKRYGDQPTTGSSGSFIGDWLRNGGRLEDLNNLTRKDVEWLSNLPTMALVHDHLLVHADAILYNDYGSTIEDVNLNIRKIVKGSRIVAWDRLLEDFNDRLHFVGIREGVRMAEYILKTFGGKRIVHGHTPISKMNGNPAAEVTTALIYAGGLCINVDGGMYLGGPGFIWKME
jgi:hypothetical protein